MEELKHLNQQITKQDDMVEHKPKPNMNNYVYASLRCVKARVQNLMKNEIQNLICMHFNLLF